MRAARPGNGRVHEHEGVEQSLRFALCGACGEAFYACAACDRFGERRYCGEACQGRGRERIRRAARRLEASTVEGQQNNRDRQHWFRQAHPGRRGRKAGRGRRVAPVATGTDGQVVTDPPSCDPPDPRVVRSRGAALASTPEAVTEAAGSRTDESLDGNDGSTARRDADLDDGGMRGATARGAGSVGVGAPAGGLDAARGPGAVAAATALRCSLCGYRGIYVCMAARGRARLGRAQSAFRRGGDASRSGASPSRGPSGGIGLLR